MSSNEKVVILKGERNPETVMNGLRLLGDLDYLSEKPILIKVNLVAKKTWATGATTDPLIVETLAKELQTVNKDITVVESDATITNCDRASEATGMQETCKKLGIRFQNLSRLKDRIEVPVPQHETLSRLRVPKILVDAHIISAAKLKTHTDTGVTLGMKNMYGLLPDRMKYLRYHIPHDINQVIVDVTSAFPASLTIIDGFVGMEGSGPIHGNPVKTNLLVLGKNVVAADVTATRIMGFDPQKIRHINLAASKGLGPIDRIEVVGERLEDVVRPFKPPGAF